MAGKGPPRLPTALLNARGSHRGKSRAKTEPKGEPLAIEMVPPEVSRKGRIYWTKFAPVLSAMGILTKNDEAALIRLCKLCVDVDYAERKADRCGWVNMEDGKQVESPWVRILDRKNRELNARFRDFGMTPASRTSVEVHFAYGMKVPQQAAKGTANKRPLGF